jgi:hypothetical protein
MYISESGITRHAFETITMLKEINQTLEIHAGKDETI